MVMKMHPFLTAYIQRCENIDGKKVVGFATGGRHIFPEACDQ